MNDSIETAIEQLGEIRSITEKYMNMATFNFHAANYYRSIILRRPPPLVPSRIRLMTENGFSFEEYDC